MGLLYQVPNLALITITRGVAKTYVPGTQHRCTEFWKTTGIVNCYRGAGVPDNRPQEQVLGVMYSCPIVL